MHSLLAPILSHFGKKLSCLTPQHRTNPPPTHARGTFFSLVDPWLLWMDMPCSL